jgi:hypothetical protein
MQAELAANAAGLTETGDATRVQRVQRVQLDHRDHHEQEGKEPGFPPLWQVALRGLFSLLSVAALVNPGLNWASGPVDQRSQPGRTDRADPSPPSSPHSSTPSSPGTPHG